MRTSKIISVLFSLLLILGMAAACSSGGDDDDCEGGCTAPPADSCTADGLLMRYEATGTCVDGACVYESTTSECVQDGGICAESVGTCVADPEARCEYAKLPDGTDCSNGLFCDGAETCLGGQCVDGMGVRCEDTGNACTVAVCSEDTEQCEIENADDGTSCDDGDACTEGDSCLAGVCQPGTDVCGQQKVAVLFYMAADNDLDEYMETDWHELEVANPDDHDWLRVFVLLDQGIYATREDTRLYEVHNGASTELEAPNLGLTVAGTEELNMADGTNVTAFIADVKAIMAGEGNVNYFLMMNDHGDGWSKGPSAPEPDPSTKGCCYDDDDPDDFISNAELAAAIDGQGLTLLGFDACLMGMAEVAYELKDTAEVLVASQEMEGGWGWDVTYLISHFGASSDPSPENYGRLAVDSYLDLCADWGDNTGTLSVIDLSQMDAVATAAGPVATALTNLDENTYWSLCGALTWYGCDGGECIDQYTDLWSLMEEAAGVDAGNAAAYQALQTAVENAVLYEGHGTAHAEAHGLNVHYACDYWPDELYSDTSWATDTGWGTMVNSH